MISQKQINEILELLPKCPKTAATIGCTPKNFAKIVPFVEDEILHTMYEALKIESQL